MLTLSAIYVGDCLPELEKNKRYWIAINGDSFGWLQTTQVLPDPIQKYNWISYANLETFLREWQLDYHFEGYE